MSPVAGETRLKLENERLPLGSLGRTAGWVMKRKRMSRGSLNFPRDAFPDYTIEKKD